MGEKLTYYDLIGVPPDASPEEIKAAWRRNMRYWHPDRNARTDALERAKAINKAFDTLADPAARERYDRSLEATRADFDLHEDVHDGQRPTAPRRKPAARGPVRPRPSRPRPDAGSKRRESQQSEREQPVHAERRTPHRSWPMALVRWLYLPLRSPSRSFGYVFALAARLLVLSGLALAIWIVVDIALYVASIIVPVVVALLLIAAVGIGLTAGSPKRKRGRRRRR